MAIAICHIHDNQYRIIFDNHSFFMELHKNYDKIFDCFRITTKIEYSQNIREFMVKFAGESFPQPLIENIIQYLQQDILYVAADQYIYEYDILRGKQVGFINFKHRIKYISQSDIPGGIVVKTVKQSYIIDIENHRVMNLEK
jgi:hypothetical protein